MNWQKLFEEDETAWREATIANLAAGKLNEVDFVNVAVSLIEMSKSEQRSVRSHVIVLMTHLLKWKWQPKKRSRSWASSIANGQLELEGLLYNEKGKESVLARYALDHIDRWFQRAVKRAAQETKLPVKHFPSENPFTLKKLFKEVDH